MTAFSEIIQVGSLSQIYNQTFYCFSGGDINLSNDSADVEEKKKIKVNYFVT